MKRRSSSVDIDGNGSTWLSYFTKPFKHLKWHQLLLLSIIIIAGTYLRVQSSFESDMVIDEATKVEAVEEYREGRFWVNLEHPPLEKYLILGSTSIFGVHDWSVKLPNMILGSLTPVLIFIFIYNTTKGQWPALTASLIASLSPIMIGYSLIAKEDTLLNFLSLAAAIVLFGIISDRMKGGGEIDRSRKKNTSLINRFDPRCLDKKEVVLGILIGASMASKFTMVFILLSWSVYLFFTDRDLLKIRGPRVLFVSGVVFTLISWYYLNPYWLGLGMYHWLVESAGGHLTYFMGTAYNYPPPWFYPIVLMGRVHPLVLISFAGVLSIFLIKAFKSYRKHIKGEVGKKISFEERRDVFSDIVRKDPGPWFLLIWFLVLFLIMTALPFKGVRYLQWIIVPVIGLSAFGIWRASSVIKGKIRAPLVILTVAVLMSFAVHQAYPHYTEWSYFLDEDSGVKDLNGLGHREALDWIDQNGGGKVSMRWTELGGFYYDNITGPVSSMDEIKDLDISYILLYIYDVQRDVFDEMTEIALSPSCRLVHEVVHGSVTVISIYQVLERDP